MKNYSLKKLLKLDITLYVNELQEFTFFVYFWSRLFLLKQYRQYI